MAEKPWYMPSQTSDFPDRPWLHEAAILYLEHLLQPEWEVLEHGAGGSTIWIAERVKSLTTIEHDIDWGIAVQNKRPDNVEIDIGGAPDDYMGRQFDLLFIDGESDERALWVDAARILVKPGGVVVLDNSNRPEYGESRDRLRAYVGTFVEIVANPPGHLYSVTEFYQMPGGA